MSAKTIHSLVQQERWIEAWKLANEALNERPEEPELLYLAGSCLRQMGSIGVSLPLFAKALAKDQTQPNLWMHYGANLHDLNEWDDAIAAFQRVVQMLPNDPQPYANIAASKTQQGKWREAIEWADKALALDDNHYIGHISRSFGHLALGHWLQGWHDAQWLYGHHVPLRVYKPLEDEEPTWNGEKGQCVVVQADQGVGDIIMYSQCLPQMLQDCREVVIECAPRLVDLVKRNFPGAVVYGTIKEEGQTWWKDHQIDAHVHISGLPRHYRRYDHEFPREAYLTPRKELVEAWRGWLAQFPRPWVGLSWKGGIHRTQTASRSVDLAALAPVMELPGSYIDLSYTDSADQIARWNVLGKAQVHRPPVNHDDYESTLALLAALDEVVTVTTAVVHACGAIGRTCRVLVPAVPMWRYAHRCGDGMIWYPEGSVKMYRRVPGEEWSSTINRVAKDMRPRIVV